jgi:hypothetical protein
MALEIFVENMSTSGGLYADGNPSEADTDNPGRQRVDRPTVVLTGQRH